jgi:N-acetylmuramoyl-L-alanine amidase
VRGESWRGQVAIAWVIRNRAARGGWWGNSIASCCRKRGAFAGWSPTDPTRALIRRLRSDTDALFRQCLAAAAAVLTGLEPDPTQGATYAHAIQDTPAWAEGQTPCATIGTRHFYRLPATQGACQG